MPMKVTVDWDGICQVTLLTYPSAKESIAYTDAKQLFDIPSDGNLTSHRYVFTLMEGCIEDIDFHDGYDESGDGILLHNYWSGRNGKISNNWELFQLLPSHMLNSFYTIYKDTRQELPKGNKALEQTPDFDKEPETQEEKKSGKSGKKGT
jgi:hypothetical protein